MSEKKLLIAKAQKRVAALLKDLQIIGGEEAVARLDAELAAAEERGRRAGIEERDGLRARVLIGTDKILHLYALDDGTPLRAWLEGPRLSDAGFSDGDEVLIVRAAFAPRDSGKEPDFLAAMDEVRDDLKRKGVRVNTVELLTELYEGRGHSHEEALRMARGEPDPEDRK